MNDNQIVDLYWTRSEKAIEETEHKFGSYCRTVSYNILANTEDAEECVNDTWLKAWNSMPTHRPSRLAPYLGKLTRWLSLTRLRSGSALKRGGGELAAALDELAGTLDSGADTEKQLELRELNRAVRRLLDGLDKTVAAVEGGGNVCQFQYTVHFHTYIRLILALSWISNLSCRESPTTLSITE